MSLVFSTLNSSAGSSLPVITQTAEEDCPVSEMCQLNGFVTWRNVKRLIEGNGYILYFIYVSADLCIKLQKEDTYLHNPSMKIKSFFGGGGNIYLHMIRGYKLRSVKVMLLRSCKVESESAASPLQVEERVRSGEV